jgi:nucleotidyltransferase/DNA polymerase involved in DNA repair
LATISNEEVELEARALLREKIERTPWFRSGMTRAQRQNTIEREVDRLWHLFVHDAAQRLIDRAAHGANSRTA